MRRKIILRYIYFTIKVKDEIKKKNDYTNPKI